MTGNGHARRGFPWHRFLLLIGLVFVLGLVPGLPLVWYSYWKGYRQTTIDALNSSASYHHDPGRAEAATWHVAEQWPWFMLAGFVFLFIYLLFMKWAWPYYKETNH